MAHVISSIKWISTFLITAIVFSVESAMAVQQVVNTKISITVTESFLQHLNKLRDDASKNLSPNSLPRDSREELQQEKEQPNKP